MCFPMCEPILIDYDCGKLFLTVSRGWVQLLVVVTWVGTVAPHRPGQPSTSSRGSSQQRLSGLMVGRCASHCASLHITQCFTMRHTVPGHIFLIVLHNTISHHCLAQHTMMWCTVLHSSAVVFLKKTSLYADAHQAFLMSISFLISFLISFAALLT